MNTKKNRYIYLRFIVCVYCCNSYLTMSDLLNKLVTQAKQEGREELRQLVSALNGQAGINIIKKNVINSDTNLRTAFTCILEESCYV